MNALYKGLDKVLSVVLNDEEDWLLLKSKNFLGTLHA